MHESNWRENVATQPYATETVLSCGWSDEAALTAGCLSTCEEAVAANTEATEAEEATSPCLQCEIANYRLSCTETDAWEACGPTCREMHALEDAVVASQFLGLRCWGTGGDQPEQCTEVTDDIGVNLTDSAGDRSEIALSGTALLIATDPLTFDLGGGEELQVTFDNVILPALTVGQTYALEVSQRCPWWCSASFVLRDQGGDLLAAVWQSGRGENPTLGGIDIRYTPDDCASAPGWCTQAVGLALEAEVPDGGRVTVSPGDEDAVGTYAISNGASAQVLMSFCSDTPLVWVSGSMVRY